MSRVVSICLCAMVAIVSVTGASLLGPVPALAASGTLTMETPLHQEPDHGSPLIALLPEGTVVSIDGPPVNGFYPVSTETLSGWMRGETLELTKDIIDDSGAMDASPEAADAYAPIEQEASEAPLTGEEAVAPSDPAPDPSLVSPPPADPALAAAPEPDPSATDAPAADPSLTGAAAPDAASGPADATWVSAAPAMESTAPAPATESPTTGAVSGLPAPTPVSGEPVPTGDVADDQAGTEGSLAGTPGPIATTTDGAPEIAVTPEPTPEPEVTPLPVVEPAPVGPAGVLVDMPIVSGPGPDYGLIFTVPAGSTVEQTGQLVDGYVSVQYKEVSGWAAREHLTDPSDFAAEAPPEETAEPIETKTPKPGSGVAFTTIDLSLRDGPSANAEPITMVPAGSRVVLTGVMEGNFQRVTYGDLVGWISNDYLSTPESPAPNAEAKGKQEKYSRREIVRYIYQAADRYGQSREDMLRVAQCESNLDPYAVNPSGSYGLFQFIRSTWKSTPYGREDIFDPRANANAAGWMWAQGRKSEWVCQ